MKNVICVVCLCLLFSAAKPLEIQPPEDSKHTEDPNHPSPYISKTSGSSSPIPILVGPKPKFEFPTKQTDDSTPIVVGDDPKKSNLPPKVFPTQENKESLGSSIVSGVEVKNREINHSKEPQFDGKVSERANTTQPKNVTKPEIHQESKATEIHQESKAKVEESVAEQDDMLHSKYKGGQDVDEMRPLKKASEKDEKKVVTPKKDPNSEVSVSPSLDKNGPKLMNATKPGQSMLESTSKMMAVSSSVLANTQSKQRSIMGTVKNVASMLLTVGALLCLGVVGLLIWKRIAMRSSGRDVLINEDDFDEVADMHTFDRAQIQIT